MIEKQPFLFTYYTLTKLLKFKRCFWISGYKLLTRVLESISIPVAVLLFEHSNVHTLLYITLLEYNTVYNCTKYNCNVDFVKAVQNLI